MFKVLGSEIVSILTFHSLHALFTDCSRTLHVLSNGSQRAHLNVMGMLWFMSDINQPSLPAPFYSVLVSISVFMVLSTVFHSINSPDNSPLSRSVLLALILRSFQLQISL